MMITGSKSRGVGIGMMSGVALVGFLVGCPGTMPSDEGMMDAGPSDAALFTLINETDPFRQWAQFPDASGTLDSNLPHGPMSRVYINATVEAALDDFTGNLPDGSIIVKENIGEDPSVTEAVLTVMWKVDGFDPDNNDWFWANISGDGQVVVEGRVASCNACHGGARDNDFVFVHQF